MSLNKKAKENIVRWIGILLLGVFYYYIDNYFESGIAFVVAVVIYLYPLKKLSKGLPEKYWH